MGGAVSLLWHEQAGPVFAATTNRYALIEAPNMQSNSRKYIMSGTPRIEMVQYGTIYSNLDDLDTDIAYTREKNMHRFHVNTQQGLSIEMEHCPLTACLVLPVIAAPSEVADITPEGMRLQKKDGVLEVVCVNGRMKVAPTDKDGRIFNPVPGFSFIPLQIFPDSPDKKIQVKIIYN